MNTLTIPLERHKKEVAVLGDEINYLKEQLAWFRKQLFGNKVEKFVDTQDSQQLCFEGFDKLPTSQPESKLIPAHERKKRKPTGKDKITLPDDLPIEQQILDIPEEAKKCPETGKELVKIGEEITSKLAHRPGSYFIKQIVRPKYKRGHKRGQA